MAEQNTQQYPTDMTDLEYEVLGVVKENGWVYIDEDSEGLQVDGERTFFEAREDGVTAEIVGVDTIVIEGEDIREIVYALEKQGRVVRDLEEEEAYEEDAPKIYRITRQGKRDLEVEEEHQKSLAAA